MARINKVCKVCNKPFSINDKQQEWLKEKGYELFSKCSECRSKKHKTLMKGGEKYNES